jgi:hypothetical protein
VNYVGHAVTASWMDDDEAFALGAMLPDLSRMAAGRVASLAHPALEAGWAFHHAVDARFHGEPAFTSWWREASQSLRHLGLERHRARAAAHVGLEMLIDGWLLSTEGARGRCRAALEAGRPDALGRHVAWREPEHAQAWESLRRVMLRDGGPSGYDDADVVARRVCGALGRRDRLRLAPPQEAAVLAWTRAEQPTSGARAEGVIDALRSALAADEAGRRPIPAP